VRRKRWVAAGIALNLLALAYFKYMNFFLDNITSLTGWQAAMQLCWARSPCPQAGVDIKTGSQNRTAGRALC